MSLQYIPPKLDEKKLLNTRSLSSFIVGAEEDYIVTRYLILSGVTGLGLYHYQQCIEKYLKAYLIDKKHHNFRNTHDLIELIKICSNHDNFFQDKDLIEGCKQLNPFEEAGRYPSEKVRSFGFTNPDILYFLDEFIYEMRKKVNRKGILDVIKELVKNEEEKLNLK